MFKHIIGWFNRKRTFRSRKTQQNNLSFRGFRQLRHEHLEDRRMLATLTVNVDTDGGITNDGNLLLREAIAYVNGDENPLALDRAQIDESVEPLGTNDTILFDSSLNGGAITLDRDGQGEIAFNTSVVIDASSLPNGLTIDADDPTPVLHNNGDGIRIFNITDPSAGVSPPTVEFVGLTLTGADPDLSQGDPQGGAIRSEGILVIRDTVIQENGADFGAGIYLDVAANAGTPRTVLTIENSSIVDNSAYMHGGAVFVRFSSPSGAQDTVSITDSSLSRNVANPRNAGSRGGALYVTSDFGTSAAHSVVITSSVFEENQSDAGGAIFLQNGNVNNSPRIDFSILEGSVISGNEAMDSSGGGLYLQTVNESQLKIADSIISGNTSGESGGGVFAHLDGAASLVIENSEISGNSAAEDGGGFYGIALHDNDFIFPTPRAITISRTLVSGNTALNRGGGIHTYTFAGTETLVEDSRITNNHAYSLDEQGEPIPGNGRGGGIYAYLWNDGPDPQLPKFTISGSTVDTNNAGFEGGGVFVCVKFDGEFAAINSTVSGNRTLDIANGRGGGIFIARFNSSNETVDAYLNNVTVTQNISQSGGGVEMANLVDVRVRINNSIISENFEDDAKTTPNNLVGRVVIAESKYNLVGSGSDVRDHVTNVATSLHSSNLINNDTPLLSTLGDHGGLTPTHALLQNSAAIDAGLNSLAENHLDSTPLTTDQRGTGFGRIYGTAVDIGAYEVGSLKVLNVIVSSASSTHAPFSFDTVDGSGTQLKTVPVGFADASSILAISVVFSEDVDQSTITENSLGVLGLRSANLPDVVSGTFGYDAATRTATWEFDGWRLAGDNYLIHLDESVRDVHGSTNYLDGEWTNPLSVSTTNSLVSEFPSGDGTPGGDFNFVITILPGDAELDGDVDSNDLGILVNFFGQGSLFFEQGDFDGDGTVTSADLGILLNNFGLEMDTLFVLADLDGDLDVDDDDILILLSNLPTASGATYAQGDLNGDGAIDQADVDLAFDQYNFGVDFDWVA